MSILYSISFSIQYFILHTGKNPKKLLIRSDLEKEIMNDARLEYTNDKKCENTILGLIVEEIDFNVPYKYCIY